MLTHDTNLPIDQQHIDDDECPHRADDWCLDGNGQTYCPKCEPEEEADFSGASDEPGYAPDR